MGGKTSFLAGFFATVAKKPHKIKAERYFSTAALV
jgi:hypothetical protein